MKNRKVFIVLAIIFIAFPVIIQGLFCLNAPWRFLEANWSAGDILTYVGTVFLGIIAAWQNERLKESNDKSQDRLEKLTSEANKLSYMAKVVEYELGKKQKLEVSMSSFQDACSTQNLLLFVDNNNSINLSELIRIEKALDEAYLNLCFSLRMHYNDDLESLSGYKKNVYEMNALAKSVIKAVKDDDEKKIMTEDMTRKIRTLLDKINSKRLEMEKEKEKYLNEKNIKLEKLIYNTDISNDKVESIY